MTLGYYVDKNTIDMKAAQVAKTLQVAFEQVETLDKWLALHPVNNGKDPLVEQFLYTVDEAYSLRVFFESMSALRASNESVFDIGRQLTGLE